MIRNRETGRRIGDAPVYVPGEPLFSFSQDPRVASNPNPIYAPGSPQYLAAVAAGAIDPNNGRSYGPAPYLVNQNSAAPLNPSAPAGTAAPIAAAASSLTATLSSLPWYYYAGGAAGLFLLFSGSGRSRH